MGFRYLAIYCRLPQDDLWRACVLWKSQCPDAQAILRIKSQRIPPQQNLLSARVAMPSCGPCEEGLGQLLTKKSPPENRSGDIFPFVFLGPEIELFLLVNPGSRAVLVPALAGMMQLVPHPGARNSFAAKRPAARIRAPECRKDSGRL